MRVARSPCLSGAFAARIRTNRLIISLRARAARASPGPVAARERLTPWGLTVLCYIINLLMGLPMRDSLSASLLARAAGQRALAAAGVIVALWLAIFWAISLP